MNNRFSHLKSTAPAEAKPNIFRQKPKPYNQQQQHQHQQQHQQQHQHQHQQQHQHQHQHQQQHQHQHQQPHSYKQRTQYQHRFRSKSNIVKLSQFELKKESFPELVSTTVSSITITDYSKKAKTLPEPASIESKIPRGYSILSKKETQNTPFQNKSTDIIDEILPSRHCAKLIMDNRQKQRDELNEIMGDMSPYWNLEEFNEEDDYSDDGWDSEEDNYVLSEW